MLSGASRNDRHRAKKSPLLYLSVCKQAVNFADLSELTEKPNDLYNAYLFANENKLNETNFLKAHKLIPAHAYKFIHFSKPLRGGYKWN